MRTPQSIDVTVGVAGCLGKRIFSSSVRFLHVDDDGRARSQWHCAQCQPHDVEIAEIGCQRRGTGRWSAVSAPARSYLLRRCSGSNSGVDTGTTLVCGLHHGFSREEFDSKVREFADRRNLRRLFGLERRVCLSGRYVTITS